MEDDEIQELAAMAEAELKRQGYRARRKEGAATVLEVGYGEYFFVELEFTDEDLEGSFEDVVDECVEAVDRSLEVPRNEQEHREELQKYKAGERANPQITGEVRNSAVELRSANVIEGARRRKDRKERDEG